MCQQVLPRIVAGLFLGLIAETSNAASFTFTTLDLPGATYNSVNAISSDGQQIAGSYKDSSGFDHGYTYTAGVFVTFDAPAGGYNTIPYGINNAGQTVGQYLDPGRYVGFLRTGSTFTSIAMPDGDDGSATVYTSANGINNAGQIVGSYSRGAGRYYGFSYEGGGFSTFDVPGYTPPPPGQSWCHGTGTQVNAINIAGQIVGSYHWFGTGPSGFLANGGDIAVIRPANANASCGFIGGMQARGVNASGNVVGFYEDELANAHGFYYADGTFVDIDVPGAIATRAFGIDDAGHVVGHYYDASNVAHGFIATPIPLPAVGWLLAPAFGVIAPWITRRRSVAYRKLT